MHMRGKRLIGTLLCVTLFWVLDPERPAWCAEHSNLAGDGQELEETIRAEESRLVQQLASSRGTQEILDARLYQMLALSRIAGTNPQSLQEDQTKRRAITLLGILGADMAAPVLMEQLQYRPQIVTDLVVDELSEYPAAQALVNLGSKARSVIMSRLRHPLTERELTLIAQMLQRIDGGVRFAALRAKHVLKEHEASLRANSAGVVSDRFSSNLRRLIDIWMEVQEHE